MKTSSELQKARRRHYRQEHARLEKKLHPCIEVDGVEILHEHRRGEVVFSAWKNQAPLNGNTIAMSRQFVLEKTPYLGPGEIAFLCGCKSMLKRSQGEA